MVPNLPIVLLEAIYNDNDITDKQRKEIALAKRERNCANMREYGKSHLAPAKDRAARGLDHSKPPFLRISLSFTLSIDNDAYFHDHGAQAVIGDFITMGQRDRERLARTNLCKERSQVRDGLLYLGSQLSFSSFFHCFCKCPVWDIKHSKGRVIWGVGLACSVPPTKPSLTPISVG